ncbi:MAG TPA: glycolate oxidase subunit GlcF [Xanthobacteraceae bacterium]|jgi:glycolate oxidase iron-sulfur subunit
MQTSFSRAQLANPDIAEADRILRTCVHCGFCTATCPTYLLLGDELDSPRGRIYLIKDMLENERAATADVVKHIDRCLSCLACMSTCPSGVHYMHLVDHARAHIEETYRRPAHDRLVRALIARLLPHSGRFRLALHAGRLAAPLAGLLARLGLERLAAMLRLVPAPPPARLPRQRSFAASGRRRGRVALLRGCVEPVIAPAIEAAAVRLLTRQGIDVVVTGAGCCGSLVHHMGRKEEALAAARRQIDAWSAEIEREGLDAIVTTASGCGTTVKDYGFMLRTDPAYAGRAARVSQLALDISEYLARLGCSPRRSLERLVVAYHSACSLQHGQKVGRTPKELLFKMGFVVKDVPEAHLCCGSAGTYNLLQPELARRLRERKVANIERVKPDVIAAGNVGCMTQIAAGTAIPVVHTVELIDWAAGGPPPKGLTGAGVSAAPDATVAAAM